MKKDREYRCNSTTEQMYLRDNGIRYIFVKIENGETIYKYKKSAKLFQVLSRLYGELGVLE